jgi:hypothetical protein
MTLIAQVATSDAYYLNRGRLYTVFTAANNTGDVYTTINTVRQYRACIIPPWNADTGELFSWNYPVNGTISGIAKINTTPVADVIVRLHREIYQNCIQETKTDVNGVFTFQYLNPSFSDYYIVFVKPPGGTLYNYEIQSSLTPIAS